MSLRLTLRTLLAYLDDTLDPTQTKAIGQKVAESDSARELIDRIKQVTRRRRLTTPPTSGPGGQIDPNTVADYLDNEVTAEQAEEVEQICLSSDVHLAEVAACHQILTLILGEPLKPPAAAAQRMIGLVKGPEAIPGRKPTIGKVRSAQPGYAESSEIDETLRLGVPPLGTKGGWLNPLILVGGGVLAALILVFAIFQILKLPDGHDAEPTNNGVARADLNIDKNSADKGEPVAEANKDKTQSNAVAGSGTKDKATITKREPDGDKSNATKKEPEIGGAAAIPAMDVAFGPANPRQAAIGQYVPDAKESGILLQSVPDSKIDWKRLTAQSPEVLSARPLVSLPASRSIVQTSRGVRLELRGNTPEFVAAIPGLGESAVQLFFTDDAKLDLDVLLERGRVVFTSTRKGKMVYVRVRFENPRIPSDKGITERQEFFDFKLAGEGDALLIDRWGDFPPTEPFYKDPKNPSRIGPTAAMGCVVLKGTVYFKTGNAAYTMTAPPGRALFLWNSARKPNSVIDPIEQETQSEATLVVPPLPKGMDAKARADILQARANIVKARDNIAAQLGHNNVDVGLAQALASSDASTRTLAVRSLAAVDDLPSVLEALDQSKQDDVRRTALEALRTWIAKARDNDYKLFKVLKEKYKFKEAEIIMEMMHGFSDAELHRPERYELLIDYLVNPNLVIRELGYFHLFNLVPAGRSIPYSAVADAAARERSEAQWRALIPAGQLPPAQAPPVKKK